MDAPRDAADAAREAARFGAADYKLFSRHTDLPPRYVRAVMGECCLAADDGERIVAVRPRLALYETGVLVLSLRIVGAEPLPLDDFVAEFVGLRSRRFDAIMVPPRVLRHHWAGSWPWQDPGPFFGRWPSWRIHAWRHLRRLDQDIRRLEQEVASLTAAEDGTDRAQGTAGAIDTKPNLVLLNGTPSTAGLTGLTDLGGALASAVAYTVSEPREGIALLARGQVPINGIEDPFFGRAHVYLFRHDDQRPTASENESAHAEAFGRILAGLPAEPAGLGKTHLPKNTRIMEDIGWYLTPLASLTVWAGDGIRPPAPPADQATQDYSQLVYEQHARAEMFEYGYALQRRLATRARDPHHSTADVLRAQHDVIGLEAALEEASPLREVREFLRQGWSALGSADLRARAREVLAVRKDEAALTEANRQAAWATALTIVFGLLAVSSLANDFLEPLWVLRGWPPAGGALRKLTQMGVATGLVITALIGARAVIRRRRRRNGERLAG
jgi:hypothetical protein